MFGAGGGGEAGADPLEDEVVGGGVVDLMPCSLGAGVDAHEGYARAELHVEASAYFLDVGARFSAEDKRWVLGFFFGDKGILELDGIGAGAFDAGPMAGLGCVGGEGGFGRGNAEKGQSQRYMDELERFTGSERERNT